MCMPKTPLQICYQYTFKLQLEMRSSLRLAPMALVACSCRDRHVRVWSRKDEQLQQQASWT